MVQGDRIELAGDVAEVLLLPNDIRSRVVQCFGNTSVTTRIHDVGVGRQEDQRMLVGMMARVFIDERKRGAKCIAAYHGRLRAIGKGIV